MRSADTSGKVGVVGARCAHRRAHLFWGRNEENGLRCVYHGWKFDCEGKCVDMPSEPEESNFKDKVRIPAYPTYEVGGVVWAYMGPAGEEAGAAAVRLDAGAGRRSAAMSKVWQQCNWLQALEGGIDTVHINFLHGGGRPACATTTAMPAAAPTTSRRRRCSRSSRPTMATSTPASATWAPRARTTSAATTGSCPGIRSAPAATGRSIAGHMWVPMDDENTMVYNWQLPPGRRGGARRHGHCATRRRWPHRRRG